MLFYHFSTRKLRKKCSNYRLQKKIHFLKSDLLFSYFNYFFPLLAIISSLFLNNT